MEASRSILQMSNNSQTHGTLGNVSLSCDAVDPVYYTNTIGIVMDWVIFLVGLPEVCLACFALLSLLKKGRAALIFAINLLLSDLLQVLMTVIFVMSRFFDATFRQRCVARLFVRLGLTASLGFMLLISAEWYVMVAWPVWYHAKNNTKLSILISLCMWTLSLTYCTLDFVFLMVYNRFSLMIFSIICLLPAPLLLGLFLATWRAINKSSAMRHETMSRRRVLGVLSLVLVTYTLLFFPFSFRNLYYSLQDYNASEEEDRDLSGVFTSALVYLSPLIDSSIYIFIRRDIRDTMEIFPCCKKPLTKLKEFQDRRREAPQTEVAL